MSNTGPITRPDITQVLTEMRALKTRAQSEPAQVAGDIAGGATPARGVELPATVWSIGNIAAELQLSVQPQDKSLELSTTLSCAEPHPD